MFLVFERAMAVLDNWLLTGELQYEEFRVRGVGPRSSRILTAVAFAFLLVVAGLCVYIALDSP